MALRSPTRQAHDPETRYPLVNIQIAIENGHRNKIVDLPLKMMIFHGYWGLPEGNLYGNFNGKLIF